MGDYMEISPLPHKAPFSFVAQVEVQSPTPTQSPADDMMMDSPGLRHACLEPPKPVIPECVMSRCFVESKSY
jgi:M-phase inducer tyrosine phosphatase